MNPLGANLLAMHARAAAEVRGEEPAPQATSCVKTVVDKVAIAYEALVQLFSQGTMLARAPVR